MRRGQMLNTVILVLVLLVALIGLWMIFKQGGGPGLATAHPTVILSATPGAVSVATVNTVEYEVKVGYVDSQTAVLSINGETVKLTAGVTTKHTLINGQKITGTYNPNAKKVRVRFV